MGPRDRVVERMTVADRVKRLIAQHLGVDDGELTSETFIREDLGADSLDAFELLMAFEEAFAIDIPDEDARKMQRVGDAVDYIAQATLRT